MDPNSQFYTDSHTRRKMLSAIAGGSITLLAGCNIPDGTADSSEVDEQVTPPEPSESNVNEFPTVIEQESVEEPFTEKFIFNFSGTPYQYRLSLEGYTQIPISEPSPDETITFAEKSLDYRNDTASDVSFERGVEFSIDPQAPDTNINYRFLIRVENQTTGSNKVLFDTNGRYFIEHPADSTDLHDGVYNLETELTGEQGTLHRTAQYPWAVNTSSQYTNQENVIVTEYRKFDTERKEVLTPYGPGWGLRQNALTISTSKSEFDLAKQLVNNEFLGETHPFETLSYKAQVDPSNWDHLDESDTVYDPRNSKPVQTIASHIKAVRKKSGVDNYFSELSIIYNIFNKSIEWVPDPAEKVENYNTNVSLPEEFWREGTGNCLDMAVNVAWTLNELGYEVTTELVGLDHACAAVKLPVDVIASHFPPTVYLHMKNNQQNRDYPEQSGEYRWIHFDALQERFGTTLDRETYRVLEGPILSGTLSEY
mgnify:FL=1